MFRIWQRRHRDKSSKARRKLEQTTDIFLENTMDDEMTLQSNEACLTEGDKFVGTTAKFNDKWEIVSLRADLRPKDVDPNFETRKDSLAWAAKSTCFIATKPGLDDDGKPISYASGTAFFVGPTTLITTGHLVPDGKRTIMAQFPGIRNATFFVEDHFDDPATRGLQTFPCKFIATGRPNADISILQVVGSFRAESYLEVHPSNLNFEDSQSVDVIGYTGLYSPRYVRKMNHAAQRDSVSDVEALFPKRELIITHGPFVLGGIMPTYRLSTVSGMSGSPVLLDGTVIGVHTGINSKSTNRCIAFNWDLVWKLLKTYGVVDSSAESAKSDSKDSPKRNWLKGMWGKGESAIESLPTESKTPSQTQRRHKVDRLSHSVTLDTPY